MDHQDDETGVRYKATWRSLCWVLVLTSLIRCVFLVATYGNLDRDPDGYRELAHNVWETGVYGWKTAAAGGEVRPTAFRPPLYPALLVCVGGFRSNGPIAVLHLALGVATAGLVACLGWRTGLGRWALAAALGVALDPILLNQSTLVMTETLATFLGALALVCLNGKDGAQAGWLSATWSSSATGLVLGMCVLCRPTFLPWIGLIALARIYAWSSLRGEVRSMGASAPRHATVVDTTSTQQLRQAAVLVGTALLVMAPWVIRNDIILGKAKLTTTHGGYTALLGNNPLFYRFLRSGSQGTWDGEELGRAWQARSLTSGPDDARWGDLATLAHMTGTQSAANSTSEFDDDRFAYALAKRYIREQPAMFVFASGSRIGRLWRWVPHRVGETESTLRMMLRYLVGVWYAVLVGLAGLGLARLGGRLFEPPWLYGVQLCFVFTAVHAVYWSDMRMRAPLIPLVCLAAASGMKSIGDRMGRLKA